MIELVNYRCILNKFLVQEQQQNIVTLDNITLEIATEQVLKYGHMIIDIRPVHKSSFATLSFGEIKMVTDALHSKGIPYNNTYALLVINEHPNPFT